MNFFKKMFSTSHADESVDLSRRRILKGAAGLAAVAVVASAGGYRLLLESETDRLISAASKGAVDGATFVLDRTAVLRDIDGVVFTNCTFIASDNFSCGGPLIDLDASCNCRLENCYFETSSALDCSAAIRLSKESGMSYSSVRFDV